MGILSGAADKVENDKALEALATYLVDEEEIVLALKVGRDIHAFTSHRLLSMDVQGLTGARKAIRSIAYRKITAFTIETAGTFDVDGELTVIVPGMEPIVVRLTANAPLDEIQALLARATLV